MIRLWRTAMLAVVVLIGLTACGDPLGPDDKLLDAQRRWIRAGRNSYSLIVTRTCECVNAYPVIVTVRDGVVQSRRFVHDSSDAGIGSTWFPAVDELFAIIDENIRRGARRVDASYDRALGYPTSVYIDVTDAVDEEIRYDVINFRTP